MPVTKVGSAGGCGGTVGPVSASVGRTAGVEVAGRSGRWENGVHGPRPLRAPRERDRHVAGPAQQPVILQAAFTAAVRDGDDVIGLPPGARGPPRPARRAIAPGWFRAGPFAVRFDDVEAAEAAGALVSLFHLLADVPRAAADLPLVDAGVAAEGPAGLLHRRAAPPADRVPAFIPLGLPPLIGRDDPRAPGAHGLGIGLSREGL